MTAAESVASVPDPYLDVTLTFLLGKLS